MSQAVFWLALLSALAAGQVRTAPAAPVATRDSADEVEPDEASAAEWQVAMFGAWTMDDEPEPPAAS